MNEQQRREAFRELAAELEGVDLPVYADYGRDPLDPVIGMGEADTRIAFFGRDPGRDEVQHHMPFIGAGGQQVRRPLYEFLNGEALPDFEASVAVGRDFFWANTVPYKPTGNKAWSMKVKKRFQPLVADLLIHAWRGSDIITLGREAFLWFAINQPREVKQQLEAFWAEENRFESHTTVTITAPDGSARELRIHPLPHPSPLNAAWYKRFPDLLRARLRTLGVKKGALRI